MHNIARTSRRLIIELWPSELLVDVPLDLEIRARDAETGEPVQGVTLIGGGGNLRFVGTTGSDGRILPEGHHVQTRSTPLVFFAEGAHTPSGGPHDYEPQVVFLRNPADGDGGARATFGSLPERARVGESIHFFPRPTTHWLPVLSEEIALAPGQSRTVSFEMAPNRERIHGMFRWFNVRDDFSLSWRRPGATENEQGIRVRCDPAGMYRGVPVHPPLVQIGTQGVLEQPSSGQWELTISRTETGSNVAHGILEVDERHANPQLASGARLRVDGAGVHEQFTLTSSIAEKGISICPSEPGIMVFSAHYFDVMRPRVRTLIVDV